MNFMAQPPEEGKRDFGAGLYLLVDRKSRWWSALFTAHFQMQKKCGGGNLTF
jgi:hypothetical protein